MRQIISKITLFCIINALFPPALAYNLEHTSRIINTTSSTLDVEYQLCDFSYTLSDDYTKECTNNSVRLNPNTELGNYIEINMDAFYNRSAPRNTPYKILHLLFVTRVSDGDTVTRFRTTAEQNDDDPNNSLSPYCYFNSGGGAIVLKRYDDPRYHCTLIHR